MRDVLEVMTKDAEDIKKLLLSYSKTVQRINTINRIIKCKQDISVRGVDYDGMPKSTGVSKPAESRALELAELKAEHDRLTAKQNKIYKCCRDILNSISDPILSTLLHMRYIDLYQWEYIATVLDYTTRHVLRLHNKALEEAGTVLKQARLKRKRIDHAQNKIK